MHFGRNSHEVLKIQRKELIKTSTPTPSWFLPYESLVLVLHVSSCWPNSGSEDDRNKSLLAVLCQAMALCCREQAGVWLVCSVCWDPHGIAPAFPWLFSCFFLANTWHKSIAWVSHSNLTVTLRAGLPTALRQCKKCRDMEPVANAMQRACLSQGFQSSVEFCEMFGTRTFVTCLILKQQSSIKQRFERLLQAS